MQLRPIQKFTEPATEAWLIAAGGRVCKRRDIVEQLQDSIGCMQCSRWFGSQYALESHQHAVDHM
jgi:hypothetical protein